ncbi:hypothetical protein GCM10010505_21670 [Kitasatospora aburaviensis]
MTVCFAVMCQLPVLGRRLDAPLGALPLSIIAAPGGAVNLRAPGGVLRRCGGTRRAPARVRRGPGAAAQLWRRISTVRNRLATNAPSQ